MHTNTTFGSPISRHLTVGLIAALIVTLGACASDEDSGGIDSSSTSGAPASSAPTGSGPPGTTAPSDGSETPGRGEAVAVPVASGPLDGGRLGLPFNPMPARLAEEYGYVEEEYLVSGDATAFSGAGALDEDGFWQVEPVAEAAEFATRILVRRPSDPEKFDGTAFVEWLNVSSGMDADPDFGMTHPELMGSGSVYVGVSAQKVGVDGEGAFVLPIEGFEVKPLKLWDPERYSDLRHPGDEFSYDIYSQVAALLRRPADEGVLGELEPSHVIAIGESQSAMRLVTYVNAIHPVADIFDGFLIHSRGGAGTPLHPESSVPMPSVARIRTDLSDPVLILETETDLFGLGWFAARQPDSETVRIWEIAGTAHADRSTLDYGFESGAAFVGEVPPDFSSVCGQINDGQQAEAARAAVAALRSWVVSGEVPPTGEPIEVSDGEILRDDDGLARGGVRLPFVEVPLARSTGQNESEGGIICTLFGTTEPWAAAEVSERYPTVDDYTGELSAAADRAAESGFLLPSDRDLIVANAEDAYLAAVGPD